jgi:hypothetical protein
MTRFFTRERFGRPQFLAGALLLAFLAQAAWLVRSELHSSDFRTSGAATASEQVRIAAGWRQLHGGAIAGAPFPDPPGSLPIEISEDNNFDAEHSPLLSLVTTAPLLAWPQRLLDSESSSSWRWLPRIPFLACGLFLGASLWYVARRLCGNTGGFLALSLYCFSPSMIQASAVWHTEPEILAAWGAFGAIFTAIAVAHTLYAPREVILWNWRRIVLLGISLAIAVAVYRQVGLQTLRACPAFAVFLPVAIATYFVWPRTRYFGNTAPGAVALLFIGLGMAHPHLAGAGFLLASVPFLLIFVAGVLADLMETPARLLVTACIWGLVGAYILWSILALAQVPRG